MTSSTSRNGIRYRRPCSVPKTASCRPWSSVVYGPQSLSSGMAAARKCASSRIVQPYPAATSDVGRSGSQTRSASQAPCGRAPEDVLDGRPHPAELADPVTFGKRREHRLVVGAAEDLDLVAFDQRAETVDRIGSFGDQPIEQWPRVVE